MQYHHLIASRPREFLTPQDFLAEVVKYFEWCDTHPLQEEQMFQFRGSIVRADKEKVRAYTRKGLATFLGLPASRLKTYDDRGAAWSDVVELIDQIIYTQKFENAAAGLLNASIISRDLGLAERQEFSGIGGGPIQTEELSARERISSRIASLASRSGADADTSEPE